MGRVLLAALSPEELAWYLKRVELRALTPKTIVQKKALKSELERVRTQEYALVDGEFEIGLRSIAVPVRTHSGKVVGAINSGVHAARVQRKEMLVRFLPVLREGAERLSIALA